MLRRKERYLLRFFTTFQIHPIHLGITLPSYLNDIIPGSGPQGGQSSPGGVQEEIKDWRERGKINKQGKCYCVAHWFKYHSKG